MSTPYTGITDYIPEIQNFKPDLNFYSNVLQTKQSQYNAGFSQMSGVYSSILNSPMLRDGNNKRRDEFLKTIDTDVKKIAGMDLSKPENVDLANKIFKPFYEDKYIIHDIAFTKKYYNELGKAETFRNCVDPDKCGGGYWDKGVQALNFQAEEYKNADPNAALNYNAPKYTPFVNVTQKAIKAAKDAGFNIELDHKENGYIVTDKNGQLLLGDGHSGPLPQFLYGIFGNDQSTIDMFKTDAYVQRKQFSKQNAGQFGSEDAAESYYLNQYINKSVPALEKNAARSKQLSNEIALKKQILEDRTNQQGGVIPGSDEESALTLLDALSENNQAVDAYHENVLNGIKTASNLNDLQAMRQRADAIVANTMMQGTLNAAAYEYAMGTTKREMKADPYALESFKTGQDIYKHKQNSLFNLQVWKEQKAFEKSEGIGDYKPEKGTMNINSFLRQQGIDPSKLNSEEYQKAIDRVTAGDLAKTFVAAGGVPVATGYEENRATYLNAIPKVSSDRKAELVNAIDVMKSKFASLQQMNLPDSGDKAKQIEKELSHILEGTGLSAGELLNGSKEIKSSIYNKNDVAIANSFGKMSVMMNDIATLWGNDVKNRPALKKTLQEQIALNLVGESLKQQVNKAMTEVRSSNLATGIVGKDKEGAQKIDKMLSSMVGKGGLFIPQKEASQDYAGKRVREDIAAFEKSIANGNPPAIDINEQQLFKKYQGEFNSGYKDLRTAVESRINSFNSPSEQPNTGGAQAAMNAMVWNVSTVNPALSDLRATNLAQAFLKGNTGVVFSGNTNTLEDLQENPAAAQTVKSYLQQYVSHIGRGQADVGFTMTAEVVDRMKYEDGDNETQPGVVYKISLNPEGAKKLLGKEYDPSQDYTYNIFYPEGQDPNQMATKARPNITDVALRIKGNSITTPVDNGSVSVTNMGDHYNISGYIKYYNPFKNAMDKKEIQGTPSTSASPSNVIAQSVGLLQDMNTEMKKTLKSNATNGSGR